jgi:hypothetical protein
LVTFFSLAQQLGNSAFNGYKVSTELLAPGIALGFCLTGGVKRFTNSYKQHGSVLRAIAAGLAAGSQWAIIGYGAAGLVIPFALVLAYQLAVTEATVVYHNGQFAGFKGDGWTMGTKTAALAVDPVTDTAETPAKPTKEE